MNELPEEYKSHKLNEKDIVSLGYTQGTLPYQFTNHKFRIVIHEKNYNVSIDDLRHDDCVFRGKLDYKHDLERVLKYIDV